jgi:hypothetical protein
MRGAPSMVPHPTVAPTGVPYPRVHAQADPRQGEPLLGVNIFDTFEEEYVTPTPPCTARGQMQDCQ